MSHRRKCGSNLTVANDNNHGFAVSGCFDSGDEKISKMVRFVQICLVLRMLVFICDVYLYTV